MHREEVKQFVLFSGLRQAVTDFGLLVKFKLTLLVLFSAVMSYAIVSGGNVTFSGMFLLTMGGFLITGAANALNQVLERDYDRMMVRTAGRPLAAGRMSVSTAVLAAGLMALAGIVMLTMLNAMAGFLGTISLISYAFVYTPMKRSTPLAVAVGAIPGALPLIIGCLAFEQSISPTAWMLFSLQFLWQFPHFWAIAWVSHTDYSKVGFKLLPADKGPTKFTALQSVMYAVLMVPIGFLPNYFQITGEWSMWVVLVANIFMVVQCVRLYQNMGVPAARRVMFSSYIYLPIVYLALMADKI